MVHGAEMRVAETRAVCRALRKAYGIGVCAVEELGAIAEPHQPDRESQESFHPNLPTATTAARKCAIVFAS